MDRNPLEKIRTPKLDQDLLEPVSSATVNALLGTCDKTERGLRDKAIILTLFDTGLRATELTKLNVADVNLLDGSVTVRKAKSRQGRFVFVGRKARQAIAAYLRVRSEPGQEQPLWLAYHRNGEESRLKYGGLRDILCRRAKTAEVEVPSLHSFRRSFAITMLHNGADLHISEPHDGPRQFARSATLSQADERRPGRSTCPALTSRYVVIRTKAGLAKAINLSTIRKHT